MPNLMRIGRILPGFGTLILRSARMQFGSVQMQLASVRVQFGGVRA